MHLARRGLVGLGVAGIAAIAGMWAAPGLLRFASAVFAAVVVGLALEAATRRRRLPGVDARPGRLALGRHGTVTLDWRNDGPRALALEFVPPLPEGADGPREPCRLALAPRGGAATGHPVLARRLGPTPLPPLRLRVLGRFGLAWWPAALPLGTALSTGPDLGGGVDPRLGRERGGRAGRALAPHGFEFVQLRDYRPGDAPRAIDWRASARRRRLVTREYAEDLHLEVLLVVDAGRRSALELDRAPRLAHYANVCARLARHAADQDDRIGLLAYADRTLLRIPPARGAPAVRRIERALGTLSPSTAESDPVAAVLDARGLLRVRGLVCLLTELDGADTGPLARAIGLLRPKHAPLVGALASREVAALRRTAPVERADAWLGLAAEEHLAATERRAAQLRLSGVPVVVAPPAGFEDALLDAYDALRRRRRA